MSAGRRPTKADMAEAHAYIASLQNQQMEVEGGAPKKPSRGGLKPRQVIWHNKSPTEQRAIIEAMQAGRQTRAYEGFRRGMMPDLLQFRGAMPLYPKKKRPYKQAPILYEVKQSGRTRKNNPYDYILVQKKTVAEPETSSWKGTHKYLTGFLNHP